MLLLKKGRTLLWKRSASLLAKAETFDSLSSAAPLQSSGDGTRRSGQSSDQPEICIPLFDALVKNQAPQDGSIPIASTNYDRRSTRQLQGRMEFQGLPISVETRRGAYRLWKDSHDGSEGLTRMKLPYGYIRGTLGVDGDAVDVFVGPYLYAPNAYIVTTLAPPDFRKVDEQKVFLGLQTEAEAKRMFRVHYDDSRFFSSIITMPMEEFKQKVATTREKPRLLKSMPFLLRANCLRR